MPRSRVRCGLAGGPAFDGLGPRAAAGLCGAGERRVVVVGGLGGFGLAEGGGRS